MPIFRVKSVKIYTGQKNLHGYIRGIRDKYQVWEGEGTPSTETFTFQFFPSFEKGELISGWYFYDIFLFLFTNVAIWRKFATMQSLN